MDEEKVYLEDMLGNAIADKIELLATLEPGSKESAAVTKDIAVMYAELTKAKEAGFKIEEANAKLAVESERIEAEKAKFEAEQELKRAQLKLEKAKFEAEQTAKAAEGKKEIRNVVIDTALKVVDITVKVVAIVLPLKFYATWLDRGMEFEKEGCFTSNTLRGFMGKLRPNKVD